MATIWNIFGRLTWVTFGQQNFSSLSSRTRINAIGLEVQSRLDLDSELENSDSGFSAGQPIIGVKVPNTSYVASIQH